MGLERWGKTSKPCSCSCPGTALQPIFCLCLFTDAFLFILLLPRWENPPLGGRRSSSAASSSAAVPWPACGTKCAASSAPNTCLQQAPSQIPFALGLLVPAIPQACCQLDLSQLAEERDEFSAEPRRKVLIRLCLQRVGWRGAAGRANRKPSVPAGKSPAASLPLRALALCLAIPSSSTSLPWVLG